MKLKIVVLFIAAGFMSFAANAQTEQGSILAGGTASLAFSKNKVKTDAGTFDGQSMTDIGFNPMVGYFFADGMVAGAGIGLNSTIFKADEGDDKTTVSTFTFKPFFRYYHESGFFGHVAISAGGGNVKESNDNVTVDNKTGVFGWEIGPGYAFFLNDNVAIEALLKYQSTSTSINDSPVDRKDINSGLALGVGFTIFL